MQKCLVISIIGNTNTGKSTLFNQLIQKKISITSNKKHTTIKQIIGVHTKKNKQYIYIDNPGIDNINPEVYLKKMNSFIKKNISINNYPDIYILTLYKKTNFTIQKIIKIILHKDIPLIIILTKIDKFSKCMLLTYIKQLQKYQIPILPISTKKKKHILYIKNILKKYLIHKKHFFHKQYLTNLNNKQYLLELLREKVMRLTGEEIPYSIYYKLINFVKNSKIFIHINIFIKKLQHKKILIGTKGKKIKKIIALYKHDICNYYHIWNKKLVKIIIVIKHIQKHNLQKI